MSRRHSSSSLHLEPPKKHTELMDDGARNLQSSDDEEYFSDASEGRRRTSHPATPSSPIPRTRIEKVDETPAHGELPGTSAYEKRRGDAVPDEVEIINERRKSKRLSQPPERPRTPGGTLIPMTVVEKVDPDSPSHGEVPGTDAYHMRAMDAAPDLIVRAPESGRSRSPSLSPAPSKDRHHFDLPVPETIVTRVDDEPAHGEVEGTEAYNQRRFDATPDILQVKPDSRGGRSITRLNLQSNSDDDTSQNVTTDDNDNQDDDNGFGDDFDEFEEGDQAAGDEDFGEFDADFQEGASSPIETESLALSQPDLSSPPAFPLVDFSDLSSPSEILFATRQHFDAMFPNTTDERLSSLAEPTPINEDSPIFPTERSQSLWKQLVTPPPLQPPNWTQSRIRRLFLISLGVPVDLDEILPPSKLKKLVLPDLHLETSTETGSGKVVGAVARLKAEAANDSPTSADGNQPAGKHTKQRKAKGPPPAPELDLAAVRRLCATTEEKIDGFTDGELQAHVKELEAMTQQTTQVLEYWLRRRDGVRREKEAFEGVIENLVRHARRTRK